MSDAAWAVIISALISLAGIIVNRIWGQPKDRSEYGKNLLEIANDATQALSAATEKHEAEMGELRKAYETRISALETRIAQMEATQKKYVVTLELVSIGKPTLVSHRIEEALEGTIVKKTQ